MNEDKRLADLEQGYGSVITGLARPYRVLPAALALLGALRKEIVSVP